MSLQDPPTPALGESFACKLTSPELAKRKQTVLACLKHKILESGETSCGFRYKFHATDNDLDQLMEFVKTERQCCAFFTFTLSMTGEFAWLELSGSPGIKSFIKKELGL